MAVKKYRIKLDGKIFEAEVEEILDDETLKQSDIKKQELVTKRATPDVAITPQAGAAGSIVAPMPGKVIAIKCKKDQKVKSGEVLLILEAMKMEQEIKTPIDGTVLEIKISEDTTVNKNDILILIG